MSTKIQAIEIDEIKFNWGTYLIRMAWVIEILAASLGLIIAWSMGLQTYETLIANGKEFSTANLFNVVLAGLPFIMVAAVEILKIPLCLVVYLNTKLRVRIIFSIALLGITTLTFETLATGFERQFHNIQTNVNIEEDKLLDMNNKIELLDKQIINIGDNTSDGIRDEIEIRKGVIEDTYEALKTAKEEQIESLRNAGSGTLADQKITLDGQLERLQNDYRKDINRIRSGAENFRKIKEDEIKNINTRTAERRVDIEKLASQDAVIKLAKIKALEEDIAIQIQNKRNSFTGIIEDESDNQNNKRQLNNTRIKKLEENILFSKNQLDEILKNPDIMNFFTGRKGELENQIIDYKQEIEALYEENITLESKSKSALEAAIAILREKNQLEIKKIRETISTNDVADIRTLLENANNEIEGLQVQISESNAQEILDIEKIESKFDIDKNAKYADIDEVIRLQDLKNDNELEINIIKSQITELTNIYTQDLKDLDQNRRNRTSQLDSKAKEKILLEEELNKLNVEKIKILRARTEAYNETNIYRFAEGWYADDIPEGGTVSVEQVSTIATIWFGSIAFIVATMGSLLAFGGFILKYSDARSKEVRKLGPIGKAFRKTLASRRKKYNSPKIKEVEVEKIVEVEVDREVEVEKIVEVEKEIIKEVLVEKIVKVDREVPVEVPKIVEVPVPVEVVKKEVVHYPIFTNDPDYLKFSKTKFTDLVPEATKKKKKKKDNE